jgi:hypothetical protein
VKNAFVFAAALSCGIMISGPVALATDEGLYSDRTTFHAGHAPRHGGPNEDSFMVTRDDRGALACYDATYYPAKYRVDPQGMRVRGAKRSFTASGDRYVLRRDPAIYLETRTRTKEDYISLRRVRCD